MVWLTAAHASTLMPPQASEIAGHVDSLYEFLVWASFISCVLVFGGFIYFSSKYKRKSETDKTAYISHSATLEFLWSFIPFVIFMVVFGWGFYIYKDMRTFPSDALEIAVQGKKWSWGFTYKSGRTSSGEFYVPVDTPVKLVMTSSDVIHSFFLPSFRNKQDVVPGRYTAMWFKADKKGTFQVFCTEYCGDQHSAMLAKMHVVSREDFDQWLQNDPFKGLTMSQIGEQVYQKQCAVCHSLGSDKKVGPGWQGLFGAQRQFVDGTSGVVDENYLRESILNPNAKLPVGYENGGMISFAGALSETELMGVIEFIKNLK